MGGVPTDSAQSVYAGQYREKEGQCSGAGTGGTVGNVRPSLYRKGYILCPLPTIYTCPVTWRQTPVSTSCVPAAVWGVRASKINKIWCLFPPEVGCIRF